MPVLVLCVDAPGGFALVVAAGLRPDLATCRDLILPRCDGPGELVVYPDGMATVWLAQLSGQPLAVLDEGVLGVVTDGPWARSAGLARAAAAAGASTGLPAMRGDRRWWLAGRTAERLSALAADCAAARTRSHG